MKEFIDPDLIQMHLMTRDMAKVYTTKDIKRIAAAIEGLGVPSTTAVYERRKKQRALKTVAVGAGLAGLGALALYAKKYPMVFNFIKKWYKIHRGAGLSQAKALKGAIGEWRILQQSVKGAKLAHRAKPIAGVMRGKPVDIGGGFKVKYAGRGLSAKIIPPWKVITGKAKKSVKTGDLKKAKDLTQLRIEDILREMGYGDPVIDVLTLALMDPKKKVKTYNWVVENQPGGTRDIGPLTVRPKSGKTWQAQLAAFAAKTGRKLPKAKKKGRKMQLPEFVTKAKRRRPHESKIRSLLETMGYNRATIDRIVPALMDPKKKAKVFKWIKTHQQAKQKVGVPKRKPKPRPKGKKEYPRGAHKPASHGSDRVWAEDFLFPKTKPRVLAMRRFRKELELTGMEIPEVKLLTARKWLRTAASRNTRAWRRFKNRATKKPKYGVYRESDRVFKHVQLQNKEAMLTVSKINQVLNQKRRQFRQKSVQGDDIKKVRYASKLSWAKISNIAERCVREARVVSKKAAKTKNPDDFNTYASMVGGLRGKLVAYSHRGNITQKVEGGALVTDIADEDVDDYIFVEDTIKSLNKLQLNLLSRARGRK